jgi:hypothetical protein
MAVQYLSTTESNTLVEMFFQDDGRGMSEAELDSLFQEFEQVLVDEENQATGLYGETNSQDLVALGLGLAMTARFVRLNCGQIAIASEKGKGTRVSVEIPFRKARSETKDSPENDSENSLPTPPMLTPDNVTGVQILTPGVLERSQSLDAIMPLRAPLVQSFRDYALTPGPESIAYVAQAVAMTTAPTFDPSTGRFPFPSIGPSYGRINVLIAEDNPLNSRLLETRLTRRGHNVKVTVDGLACAETFKAKPDLYDVILMDLQVCFFFSIL